MSIEAIHWALNSAPDFASEDPRKRPHLAIVLIGLANHADPDGRNAFPAIDTLCRYTRLSESTVRRCVQRLLALGVIRPSDPDIVAAYIKRGDRRPNGYDLVFAQPVDNSVNGVSYGPVDNSDGVSYEAPRGVTPAQKGSRMTPEPSVNRPENRPSPERGRERALTVVPDTAPETDGRMGSATENDTENAAMAARIVAGLDLRCGPTPRQVGQIADAVGAALARGVVPAVVAEHARRKAEEAQTVKYLVRAFSAEHLPAAPAQPAKPGIPPVCGQCDARPGDQLGLRQTTNAAGQVVLCPRCHPSAMNQPTGGAA